MRILISFLMALMPVFVTAAPVTWTLNDVTFDDGTTATGSFVYDASTNTYSDIQVYTFDSLVDSYSYDWTDTNYDTEFGGIFLGSCIPINSNADYCGVFYMDFSAALTNAGGVVAVATSSYEQMVDVPYYEKYIRRDIVSGSVSAVPLPAAVWLFGAALGSLGWVRRRSAA